ncbi:Plastidial pyruvate kinase 2 [Acorus calamus]|uniref:pyruvate kinase n=2 Tax=Magnoliopsida TaxID=3398 RepID=A0AAV9F2Y1_ACOCL|nr:Plastidial pyruvate kinase 2 [Acorus calamus]
MAQVVASRSVYGSLLCPGSGHGASPKERLGVLTRPRYPFTDRVRPRKHESRGTTLVVEAARRSARVESAVVLPVTPEDVPKEEERVQYVRGDMGNGGVWSKPGARRKTKIVCTIGPSTNTREMIWKLAEAGMNVARLNMSHGDHASHQKVIDLVKEYNAQSRDNPIAIMLDTKGPEVRSGDLPQPINLAPGQEFTFTIRRGVGTENCVSVNYDDFINDVDVGDMLLVDDKDWDDIKFGVENKVDFYAVSFVKDAKVVHELKDYLQSCAADIHVTVKIESADSIPNLYSIISASDGAMVARGDLGAELPIEEVPLLQEEIIRLCRSMGKAVIVATNMLESMIVHPTPTRAEVSDIAIAVREGADAVMLSGETAHGKFPLKAVKVMHTVALRTEDTMVGGEKPANLGQAFKKQSMVKEGEEIALVQSGRQSIWRSQSTHNIQRAPLLRPPSLYPSPGRGDRGHLSLLQRPRSKLARLLFLFEKVDYLQWLCTVIAFFFVVILFQAFLPGLIMEKSGGSGIAVRSPNRDFWEFEGLGDLDFGEGIRFEPTKLLERFRKEREEANSSALALGRPRQRLAVRRPELALVVADLSPDASQLLMVTLAVALKEIGYTIQVFALADGPVHAIWRNIGVLVTILHINDRSQLAVDWLNYNGVLVNSLEARVVVSCLSQEPFRSLPVIWTIPERALALRLAGYASKGQMQLISDWKQAFSRATVVVFPNYVLPMMYSTLDFGNYFVIPGSPSEAWEANILTSSRNVHELRVEKGYASEDFIIAIVGSQFTYTGSLLEDALILKALVPLFAAFPSDSSTHSHMKIVILNGNSTIMFKNSLEDIALNLGYPKGSVEQIIIDKDESSFLSMADIVVYGSFLEEQSFPPILIKAMCLGKPVIAPDLLMIRKYVNDRVNGYLFPKENIGLLTETLFQVISGGKLSRSAQNIALVGKENATNLMVSEAIEGYASLLENVLQLPSEISSPKAVAEIPEHMKDWQWILFKDLTDLKYMNGTSNGYRILDKLEEQWFAVSEALRRMYNIKHDIDSLPPMPADGDSWSVMHSWVLPSKSFLEFVMFSRMFVDALDSQMYDEHHRSGYCYLSLTKDRQCYSRVLELLVNVWAYHSARRMVYVNPETGAMLEQHKFKSRRGHMWVRLQDLLVGRMNGKKGSCVKIDIDLPSKAISPEQLKKPGVGAADEFRPPGQWIRDVWRFAKDDPKRVIFALKVGLAVLLVSLLILFRAPYDVFGTNIIWSILTVAIMFEYTVGATFNKGFNRALGSIAAGVFAITVMQVATSSGHVAEPFVIGFSIFLIGTVTSFMKLWPSLTQYEYGFRVTLFTYCLIVVSGYRMGTPVKTAMDRLYSIAIGGLVAVLVNVLIYPIWAGEQLHKELVNNFNTVAATLEECVKKYLEDDGTDRPEFDKTVMDDFADEPAFRKCRTTLNSSAKLDSLANSAKWEPPHGRFRHFFYPWCEYVKVGAVLRHCAYEAPYNLRIAFQPEIQDSTNQAAELLRSLGKDISSMKRGVQTTLLKRLHSSTERLQRSIDIHSYLLKTTHHEYSSPKPPSKPLDLPDPTQNPPPPTIHRAESYHETMRKQQKRLYSWPSREVDEFGEEGGFGGGDGVEMIRRMRALESTAAMSLATFTSLLIEFVARLDHLVDAVDKLAKMARFKEEEI